MPKFNILNKLVLNLTNYIIILFIFKISLLLLYFIGDYQIFSNKTIKLLIRIILSNDIILIFFSFMDIFNLFIKKNFKMPFLIFLIFNIIFSFITIFIALLTLVL